MMTGSEPIQLVEQHLICRNDPHFEIIDHLAFASKNLYNKVNYLIRQAFIFERRFIPYGGTFHLVKGTDEYKALPRKVSNQVLKQLDQNWRSFLAAQREWEEHPEKFLGRPGLPGYKHKTAGRNLLVYDQQAISTKALRKGFIRLSGLDLTISTQHQNVDQVRIVPRKDHYVVEVVYTIIPEPVDGLNPEWVAGVDIGLNNLAALTSYKPGFTPLIVNGRPLKAINQYYHKVKAKLQSLLAGHRRTSERIISLTNKRNRKIKHYLHVASRRLINHLVAEGIGVLVIGQNQNWKQKVTLGRQTNQAFVSIPMAEFVKQLRYKAQLKGIQVILQEESYTSKCSCLDLEPVGKLSYYIGQRVKRGLFQAGDGRLINADVNGSYNIIRKANPEAFKNGISEVILHPINLPLEKKPQTQFAMG